MAYKYSKGKTFQGDIYNEDDTQRNTYLDWSEDAVGIVAGGELAFTISGSNDEISSSYNLSASAFYGDGSALSNITATASPAGSDTNVQYNDGGSTGGDSGFVYDGAGSITVTNSVTASNGIKSDGVNQFTAGTCFSPPVAVTSSIKYYPQVLGWLHYALPATGAFVIHTNITASSHEMFEIRVHGYNYFGAGMIDFTIGGYAYATMPRTISGTGSAAYGSITDNGSDGYRKWLGIDANGYVSIAIGDYDLSNTKDHYFWNLSADFWSLRNLSNPYEGDPWSVELSAVEGFGWTDIRGVYGQAGVPMTAPITSKATWGNSWVMINTGSSGGESNPPLYTLDVNGDIRVSDDLFVDDFASLDSCRIGTTQTDPGTGNLVVEGSVGIGTDTPSCALDVQGYMSVGVAGTAYIINNNDTNTHIKLGGGGEPGLDGMTFTCGGKAMLTLDENGLDTVTVGTTGDATDFKVMTANTDYALYVSGGADRVGIGTATPNSTFQISGSQAGNYTAITDDITLNETHYIVDLTDTDDATVTLPAASGVTGRTYHILSTGDGEQTLTITGSGGQFMGSNQDSGPEDSIEIEGSAQSVTLLSTGTYWFILTDNRQQGH